MKPWAERFYKGDTWQKCRDAYLTSRGYLCERCSSDDNPVVAKVVHHRIYLTRKNITDPWVTLSWDNLEALCQGCHNKEHHRREELKRYLFDKEGNLKEYIPPIEK